MNMKELEQKRQKDIEERRKRFSRQVTDLEKYRLQYRNERMALESWMSVITKIVSAIPGIDDHMQSRLKDKMAVCSRYYRMK